MKLKEVIDQVTELKPSQYQNTTFATWISLLDSQIYKECISKYEGTGVDEEPGPYDATADAETVLLVPEPYSELYVFYVSAQIDLWNAEISRYNNNMAMYNTRLSELKVWYNGTHLRKQTAIIEI